jgi:regulator of sigma E protease
MTLYTFALALVLFGILILFHELGHFVFAKLLGVKVLKFSIGFGPKLIGKKIGETEYVISLVPLGGYVKPLGEEAGEEIEEREKDRAFNFQPVWKRALIVLAGPVFNLLLAYVIFVVFLTVSLPVAIPSLKSITATIEDIADDSPAMRAGIRKNDVVVSINEKSVSDWSEMAALFSNNPGVELNIRVKRGDELVDLLVTPEPTSVKGEDGKEITVGRIGISKKMDFKVIESSNVFMASLKGAEAVYDWSALTLEVVWKMLTGGISVKQVGGPILIVDAASKAASAGAATYFGFIAIISINLAILNLLPIPVLDGGHLMFMSIEALRGKPLSEKVMNMATRVGFSILMLLIAFVFYNDTIRIIVPWVKKTFVP